MDTSERLETGDILNIEFQGAGQPCRSGEPEA